MQGVSVTRAGRGSPAPAQIEAGGLRLELDPVAPRLALVDACSGLVLRGIAPDVDVRAASDPHRPDGRPPGGAALLGGTDARATGRWLAIGEVKAAAGPALRLEVQMQLAAGIGMRWTLEVPAAGTGVVAALAVENRGAGPIRVDALAPLAVGLAGEGLALASVAPSSAGSLPVRVLRTPATALAAGFTTARRVDGRVEIDLAAPERRLRLESLAAPTLLTAGESLESERAWLGVGGDEAALLVEWARRAAAEMDARVPLAPVGASFADADAPNTSDTGSTRTSATARADLASASAIASADAREGRITQVVWTTERPTLSGVGFVDALALPPEDGPAWIARALDLAFTGRRLWGLEPGPALHVRAAAPTAAERTRFCVCALVGGVVRVEGDPARLDAERARWLELASPPLGRGSHARRIASGRALVTPLPGGRTIVLLVNESIGSTPIGVTFAELGLAGSHHLFDFWAEQDGGARDDGVAASLLPAGGSRLLALTPAADRPTVIGTTLHVGMGALEVSAVRSGDAGALSLHLRLPGRHRGAVWIAVPGEPGSRRVEVDLAESLTVSVPAPPPRPA